MDTALYKLYLFKRTPQYYDLREADWNTLRAHVTAQQQKFGVRDLFNARMTWSNERYQFFGVEFYPSLEAVQGYTQCVEDLGFFQYFESESFLGIPMDNTYPYFFDQPAAPGEKPVYRVYLTGKTDFARQLSAEELEQRYAVTHAQAQRAGAQLLLSAYMRWNNEGYDYFGIERFPNMEALIGFSQFLSSSDWYHLVHSRSYLGTAFGGIISGVNPPA